MARHLLRSLAEISFPDEILPSVSGDFALNLFRCSITILSGVNRHTLQFSSPYEPIDRPETHYLAYTRKDRIFSASISSGMPETHFHFAGSGGVGFANSTQLSIEDELLVSEIQYAAKDVSLTTKHLADQRVEILKNDKLWKERSSEDQAIALQFFENWYEWGGEAGAFWKEWYEGFVVGKPLDWELQRQVASIKDSIWKDGPEAVAAEINKIRAKFELRHSIAAAKGDLKFSSRSRLGWAETTLQNIWMKRLWRVN